MSIELLYPFTTPANYTFDSDVIVVSGGKAKLKDQRPADATFHANYNADVNGNWGNGVLTGTAVGGAVVSGGELDLTGGTAKYVDYDIIGNADHAQVGCIRFDFRPNFTGPPAAAKVPFALCKVGSLNNLLQISILGGNIYFQAYDTTSGQITNSLFGAWSPVAGVSYEFELNWDITSGATRLFIDGVQLGAAITATGTRDNDVDTIRIGNTYNVDKVADFKIDNLIIFDAVQHAADYTPGQSIPATIYSTADPSLVCNATFRHEGIDAFTETKAATGNDQIQYILKKGTVKYYWSGSAWAVSDGTYGQSNTAATIETNRATFTDTAVTTEVTVFLHSDDGSTTPEFGPSRAYQSTMHCYRERQRSSSR